MSHFETPNSGRLALTVGAVGVVYGDIGTSPLYAFREALRPAMADGLDRAEVLGVVSLLLWALVLVVTLKYVLFLLRADNRGEGGILALYALVLGYSGRTTAVFFLGIIGAALFFGDAIITPAISVLSAVEGLKLITPIFNPYVEGISIGILFALFIVQNRGTGPLARYFGPITVVWFLAMAIAGLVQIIALPEVLAALHPGYALGFLAGHGVTAFIVLGAVFLAVTGAEALYADLGHFGRGPIQLAWFSLVLPALTLNYLGQGALVLQHPEAISHPFFLLVPEWILPGMVALATLATVIASQAVITGAFSMTRQAVQLGLMPRFEIRHTSETETGQIFLPVINILLLTGVLILVTEFHSSEELAAAYGIAVCGTMVVTTLLAYRMLHRAWRWPRGLAILVTLPLLTVETAFLSANLLKIPDGGYVPLLMGATLVVMMWTWHKGTKQLQERTRKLVVPLAEFIPRIERGSALRVSGTAVFLTSDREATPPALLHNLKHNGVLHEHIIVVTVETTDTPRVPEAERATIEHLCDRFQSVQLRFGFMETPNVNRTLGSLRRHGLNFEGRRTSFFLGRRKLVSNPQVGMPVWQDRLYILLARLAADPSDFYHLPRDRVVELGAQVSV
ncbi:potassium transporter Kup [Pseudoprimorskyibacter insulae]|uniref:Probable potassium transport system protein Kup n=1 Tax=Pseudoprimorskyibacter insulae TaxID=1695997 RepID=A0A2R8AXY9_9RHOB|nr:potassium transporter Kup [Pseudoprimorskyibacter insulae]SPF80912.1 Low affinity potassium transport system protein kup [Pseudoprimorskyibacter insulae]